MFVKCTNCRKVYDMKIFELQQTILCESCGALVSVPESPDALPEEKTKPLPTRGRSITSGKLVIEVAAVKGTCPIYEIGDTIVLDQGYRLNLKETQKVCMHSLASILPYYNALYHGVSPRALALARPGEMYKDVAFVQCLDPCEITGGGSVTFKIYRKMTEEG